MVWKRTPISEALRGVLRECRASAALTQSDVARRLHWPQSVIAKIELGERIVSTDDLVAIAEVLGVSPVRILEQALQLADRSASAPRPRTERPARGARKLPRGG